MSVANLLWGVNDPFSIWITCSLYYLFFSLMCDVKLIDLLIYDGEFGCMIRTSTKVFSRRLHKPLLETSNLAFSLVFLFCIILLSNGNNSGTIFTSLHTSLINSASRSHMQLCLNDIFPLFTGQGMINVILGTTLTVAGSVGNLPAVPRA